MKNSKLSEDLKNSPMCVWLLNSDFEILDFSNLVSNKNSDYILKDSFKNIISIEERDTIRTKLETENSVKHILSSYNNIHNELILMKKNENILAYLIEKIPQSNTYNILENLNKSSQFKINQSFKENLISICYILEDINVKNNTDKKNLERINTLCFQMLKNISNIDIIALENKNNNTNIKINLWDIVAELLVEINTVMRKQNFDFSYTLPDEDVYILASSQKLVYAILNIISNAYIYGGKGTSVSVCGINKDNSAVIIIKNTKNNQSKVNNDELFSPFYTEGVNKLGLGLTSVKSIVESLNGQIFVSENENETLFTLSFPISEAMDSIVMNSYNSDYLENKFSPLYISLSDIITPPLK